MRGNRQICVYCGYTWQPRGRDISLRCPGCGTKFDSEDLEQYQATLSGGGLGFGGLFVIGILCTLLYKCIF
jgi:tRNA(Ile2) C34 agmatinyltransferase TiaS